MTGPPAPSGRGVVRTALVETAIGWCGLAWNDVGLVAVQLPERDRRATADRLRRRVAGGTPAAPDGAAALARDGINTLLATGSADLGAVPLDLVGTAEFDAAVYAVVRAIPPGRTRTYGDVAAEVAGPGPGAARAVGAAMGRNPWPLVVPCHRVLAAHGELGGFSAHGGTATKRHLLFLEGALASEALTLFDA